MHNDVCVQTAQTLETLAIEFLGLPRTPSDQEMTTSQIAADGHGIAVFEHGIGKNLDILIHTRRVAYRVQQF